MQVAIVALITVVVGFAAGVLLSHEVLASAMAIVASAHAAVAGGAKDVQDLAARVSSLEKRLVADVKAEVAKV